VDVLLEAAGTEANVLGPAPAPLARLRGRFRFHALLRGRTSRQLHGVLARALDRLRPERRSAVDLTVNVDPLTMM
jgi:primosomal protein N' (replication factor Y) (superfamily II helicase)